MVIRRQALKNPLIAQRAIFSVAERKRFELLVRF